MRKVTLSRCAAVCWLILLLVCMGAAQATPAEKQQAPVNTQTQAAAQAQAPEQPHKLTAQEAEELFKSADEILQFVSKDTGLPIKHKVDCKLASRDEVVKYVEEKLAEDEDAQRLERSAVSLKKFGLLPRDFELRPYLLGLLKEQVAGFYDSKTKKLYLLDWVEPEAQKPVLAHELTHALQDQNYDILKWGEGKGKPKTDDEIIAQDEESSAKQAVIEGQAMITLLDYSLAPMGASVVDSPAIVEAMKAGMVTGGGSPLYDKAPMFLRQALIFPYQYGMDFVRDVLVKKGREAAFAGTMRRPPATTREIMMPATYVAGEQVTQLRPPDLDKVLGKDYARYDFGGIGQFDVGVMMDLWEGAPNALNAAPGWRGGYYWTGRKQGAKDGPVSMIFVTRWASTKEANDFAKTYAAGLKKRYLTHEVVKELTDGRGVWKTEEGVARVTVKNDTVVAVEGFAEAVSAKVVAAVEGTKQ